MTRSRALGVAVAAILTLGGAQATPATNAAERALTVRSASGYHRLPLAYAGFNAPFRRNSWQAPSPRLHQAVAALTAGRDPRVRRDHGQLLGLARRKAHRRPRRASADSAGGPGDEPDPPLGLGQLVKDANAIPVFDLNMVTSTLAISSRC